MTTANTHKLPNTIPEIENRNYYFFKFINTILIFFVLFKDSLTGYPFFLNYNIRYIDDILMGFIYLIFIGDIFRYGIRNTVLKKQITIFLLLFLFNLVQLYILNISIIRYNFLVSFRDHFWYYPVFYFIVKYGKNDIKHYYNMAILFINIQIIFSLFQILYTFILEGKLLFEDDINGSLGDHTSHILAYTIILFIPLLFHSKKKKMLIAIIIIFLLASARSAIFFMGISLLLIFLFEKKYTQKLKVIMLLLVLSSSVYYIYNKYTNTTLNIRNLYKQNNYKIDNNKSANRVAFINSIFQDLHFNEKLLLGFGCNSYASRTASKLSGYKFSELKRRYPFILVMINGGGEINVWLSEYGIIGLILFLFFYIKFLLLYKTDKVILFSMIAAILGFTTVKLMESYAFGYNIWLLGAIYYHYVVNNKKKD